MTFCKILAQQNSVNVHNTHVQYWADQMLRLQVQILHEACCVVLWW